MTEDEKARFLHQQMHEKHKGHDSMHAEMLFILIITLIVAQFVLFEWKKRHYRSYLLVSLLGLWLIPAGMCVRSGWWRFIFFWVVFSLATSVVMRKAYQKPITGNTPRLVYKFFLFIYKLSYGLGIFGYIVMMMTFCGINLIFNATPQSWMDVALLFIFYGLYYGVLGRDLSELCTDKMTCHLGYYNVDGMPTKSLPKDLCGLCAHKLFVSESETGLIEDTYKLTCDHVFHE
jgi:RING finger protein 121/175